MSPRSSRAATANTGLAILTLINLFNYLDRYVVSALVESLKKSDLHLTDTQAGSLATAFLVVYMLTSPIFGTLGGTLHTIVGGNITAFTRLCEVARAEAFEIMVQHASEIGANAVIGMRYDANEIMNGVTEVLAYGTAVVVEPID